MGVGEEGVNAWREGTSSGNFFYGVRWTMFIYFYGADGDEGLPLLGSGF